MEDFAKIVEAVPLPGFIALTTGTIVYGNDSLATVTGQPELAALDRTLFGLGIFHNTAEYRGFILSFRHGGNVRKLVLPLGRLNNHAVSLVLYATRITWEGQPALCGILHRSRGGAVTEAGVERSQAELLHHLDTYILQINAEGQTVYLNHRMADDLGIDRSPPFPNYSQLDVDHDAGQLERLIDRADTEGVVTYQSALQKSDGTLISIDGKLKVLTGTGREKRRYLITATNADEHRLLQQRVHRLEMERDRLRQVNTSRRVLASERDDRYRIVSRSPHFQKVLDQINQVATTDSTVLITGETGTGKELIARAVHTASGRAENPLVILNCGALPAELIESELFGYRKGAFTGADKNYLGRFALADQGTLFLDEIGEMPLLLQTRLLRFLQEGEFVPLGGKETVSSNVRIVAATNRDLERQVGEGKFRADLYYRLNVFPIHSLPLRERTEDIPVLVEHFIKKYRQPDRPLPTLNAADLERLCHYSFPGNVRELENIVQRALILRTGDELRVSVKSEPTAIAATASTAGLPTDLTESGQLTFEEMQRRYIIATLATTGGKVSGQGGAAEILDLKPQTLFSKMRKLGISRNAASSDTSS